MFDVNSFNSLLFMVVTRSKCVVCQLRRDRKLLCLRLRRDSKYIGKRVNRLWRLLTE